MFCARARILLVAVGLSLVPCAHPVQAAESVPELIKALRSADLQARTRAQEKLVQAGPAAVKDLVAELTGRRRLASLSVLVRIGPRAVPRLIELLSDAELRSRA